jgi:hypothetical protein
MQGTQTTSGGSDLASVVSSLSGGGARFDDHCVRDLAFDLGVDARTLKGKLAAIFTQQQV